jgi:hypothetical protein
MSLLATLLLLLALAATPASACAFARMAGISSTSGSPHTRHLLANTTKNSTAGSSGGLTGSTDPLKKPAEWVTTNATGYDRLKDASSSAINSGNMFIAEGQKLTAMLTWAQAQGNSTDLCHWGIISMPTPNFNGVEFSDTDATVVYDTMQDALKRAQGLVKRYKGTFLLAAASTGHLAQHRLCGLNAVQDKSTCSASYLAPTTRQHPTSSLMWRIKAGGSNIEEIVAGLTFWFYDPEGHRPERDAV